MTSLALSPELEARLRGAENVVVFSGAGVSRESGIDTFRGAGGLWERMRPEELATPEAFHADPAKVWSWYAWRHSRVAEALPNPAHHAIARWEDVFPYLWVVTQNVDGLHQRAGSRNLLELHGSLARAHCERCGRSLAMGEAVARSASEPPLCPCGGRFRPSVVWFGERLPEDVLERATEAASECDLFLSVGTAALVYPAAGLIDLALRAGALLIEVNPEATPFSPRAHLRYEAPAGEVLPLLGRRFEELRS